MKKLILLSIILLVVSVDSFSQYFEGEINYKISFPNGLSGAATEYYKDSLKLSKLSMQMSIDIPSNTMMGSILERNDSVFMVMDQKKTIFIMNIDNPWLTPTFNDTLVYKHKKRVDFDTVAGYTCYKNEVYKRDKLILLEWVTTVFNENGDSTNITVSEMVFNEVGDVIKEKSLIKLESKSLTFLLFQLPTNYTLIGIDGSIVKKRKEDKQKPTEEKNESIEVDTYQKL